MTKTRRTKRITWRQPVVFIVSTIVCTILAIWAVVAAPVESAAGAATGVSGLYIAAAVYVPVALWFGVWGCFAGYLSCIFMGIYLNMPLEFVLVWALADFFEGFVPLVIYRSLKIKPVLGFKHPKLTYGLNVSLAVVLIASAYALVFPTWLFIATFVLSILLVIVQAIIEDRKTWLTWLPIGVIVASFVSGTFGVGAMALFGSIPLEAFPAVFSAGFWRHNSPATLGTILTVALTPYIVKSKIYVRRYFS